MPIFETQNITEGLLLPPVTDDQSHIESELSKFRSHYLTLWNRMLEEWLQDRPGHRVWLLYACSYLFRSGQVRWSIDPVRPNRLVGLPQEVPLDKLKALSFILLTHDHADHFDPVLLSSLGGTSVRVMVPAAMLDDVRKRTSLDEQQIMVAHHGQTITLDGIQIMPFEGWHQSIENPASYGYPTTGYRIDIGKERWLFPGDVRDYQLAATEAFGPVDCLFAHLWLGRQCALMEVPPLLEPFSAFIQQASPRRIMLAHLYEFSRKPDDLWHKRHLQLLLDLWEKNRVRIPMVVPYIHEGIDL